LQRARQAETTMESCAPQSKVVVSLRFEGLNCANTGHRMRWELQHNHYS
jgi:hypothetical protein